MEESREIIELLKEHIRQTENHISHYEELLQQSERRIDRTNEMVTTLVNVCSSLKETYMHHIDQVCECRDNAMKQNSILIQELNNANNRLNEERHRYDNLLQTIIDIVKRSPAPSVNINQ